MATVDLGESVWLSYRSTGSNGNLIVPGGAVTATVTQPDGTLATPSVTNTAAGNYETTFVTAQSGRHTVRWTTTGANPSVDVFDVLETYPPYIVSLDDAKTLLQFADDVDADEELRKYSAAATGIIERYMRRAVVRRVVTETHYQCCTNRLALRKRPIVSLTSLTGINGIPAWDVAQLYVDTTTGIVSSLTAPGWFRGDLVAIYVAGDTVIPGHVQEAARIVIQHLWATRRGLGGNLITQQLPGFNIGYALPQSVKDLLGPPPPLVA